MAERRPALSSAAQIVLFGLGGVIAVAGLALSASRHQQELAAAERDSRRLSQDAEREFRGRFVTAVDLLSAEEPIKRTAALYALAALADDWKVHGRRDETQVCIDVICGYLRAPLREGETRTSIDEVEVKTTGYTLIRNHLSKYHPNQWTNSTFNLTKAHIDFRIDWAGNVTLENCRVSLKGAKIVEGGVLEAGVTISKGGTLDLDEVVGDAGGLIWVGSNDNSGAILVREAQVQDGGKISISSPISDGAVLLMTNTIVSSGGIVDLGAVKLLRGGFVSLREIEVRGGSVNLDGMEVGGDLHLIANVQDRGSVTLNKAIISNGGDVSMFGLTVDKTGRVSLEGAIISGDGVVNIDGAKIIAGGEVELRNAVIQDDSDEVQPHAENVIILPDRRRMITGPRRLRL